MNVCMKCGYEEGAYSLCAYCNWKHKIQDNSRIQSERVRKEVSPEEVVCYQIEILVPEGIHSYIYSDKIPSDESVKEQYGIFARTGNVSPLMHIVQHRQILADKIKFWSDK